MHAFFMSPQTADTSAGRTLKYQRELYLKYFSRELHCRSCIMTRYLTSGVRVELHTKETSYSLSSSGLSSTTTLVEHDDIDVSPL